MFSGIIILKILTIILFSQDGRILAKIFSADLQLMDSGSYAKMEAGQDRF